MIAARPDELRRTARRWARRLARAGLTVKVMAGESTVGGGSLPGETLPTWLVVIHHPRPDALARQMRASDPPAIGRIEDDRLLLDPRTVLPDQAERLLQVMQRLGQPE